jgi:hypothetical protein
MPKSKRKIRSTRSKSGFFGVTKLSSGRYRVSIRIDGKMKNLGSSHVTAKQAAKAYDKEAIKLRRPFSKLNYPEKAPVGYTPIQQPLYSNNTVGYRGVRKSGKNYRASVRNGGKLTHIGSYDTAKEAAIAYDRAVLKANRSTTLLNFPDMVHNLDVEPKRKKYKRSSTGYRGVKKDKRNGKFRVQLCTNGKIKSFGPFDTAIQAALAYDQAAIKAGKKKSTLNFPKEEKKQEKQKKLVKEKKQKKQKKSKKKGVLTMQEYKEMLEIWEDME